MPTNPAWPEAMATVTSCKYEFGTGQALAFGVPKSKHFVITFNYWANGNLHTGEFASAKPIPQSTLFPITYNPESAHEHSHSAADSKIRSPVLMIGIIGSLVLSLVWFAFLHGCR